MGVLGVYNTLVQGVLGVYSTLVQGVHIMSIHIVPFTQDILGVYSFCNHQGLFRRKCSVRTIGENSTECMLYSSV